MRVWVLPQWAAKESTALLFELPPLPYPKDALEPHISAETVDVHYEKHHRGYFTKLQQVLAQDPQQERSLEEIIASAAGPVFNNAAQVWNHTFYWRSMQPRGGKLAKGRLADLVCSQFGSIEGFNEQFRHAADGHFGSGYVWLVRERRGERRLVLKALHDAHSPLLMGWDPILCLDIWEHAYYLDRRNDKAGYVKAFLDHLANWEFAETQIR